MRGLFGRRKRDGDGSGATAVVEQPPVDERSDEELDAEIRRLSERARAQSGLEDERELIRLRNEAGIRRLRGAAGDASFADATAALPAGDPLPEFSRDQVTPEL